jgi:hypothetical protein
MSTHWWHFRPGDPDHSFCNADFYIELVFFAAMMKTFLCAKE